jgi:hypothetical protein
MEMTATAMLTAITTMEVIISIPAIRDFLSRGYGANGSMDVPLRVVRNP